MNLPSELISAIIAAIITAWFAKNSSDKRNSLDFITKERQKWRDDIRKETEEVTDIIANYQVGRLSCSKAIIELQKAIAFFKIRLNPIDDKEDEKILDSLYELQKFIRYSDRQVKKQINILLKNFQSRTALLLKHDWERSKAEISNKWKIGFILLSLFFTVSCFFISEQHNFSYDYQPYDLISLLIYIVDILYEKHVLCVIAIIADLLALYYLFQLIIKKITPKNHAIRSKHCHNILNFFDIPHRVSCEFLEKNNK